MTVSHQWIGRLVAYGSIGAAVMLGLCVLIVLDHRPRTHDAHLFAYSAGIAPELNGRVIAVHVANNQRVTRGEPLIDIDPEPFELRLRQVHAQVVGLQAQIALTGRQVAAQSTGAAAARTQVVRAQVQSELARNTLQRLAPLLNKGYVTTQQIDEARTSDLNAHAALSAAIQQATQAHQAIGDTASLVAQLSGAEAAEALAARDLREVTLRAPFDGRVVGLDIAEGTFAAAGHPLLTVIKTHDWYAIGDFRETELPRIAVGDRATIWVMGADDRPITGQVEGLGPGVQPEDRGGPGLPMVGRTLNWVVVAQRIPVWIRLEDPPEPLMRVGVTVSVKVHHVDRH